MVDHYLHQHIELLLSFIICQYHSTAMETCQEGLLLFLKKRSFAKLNGMFCDIVYLQKKNCEVL